MQTSPSPDRSRTEWIAVAAISAVGLVFRLWPIGRLGLTHFDEGIYAMAGAWALDPRGLAAIDSTLIPYAPPGFAILVGLMYALLGRSDVAAIAVSQIAGTLTIPAVAWLARRTFGVGSGFAAATLAALSGPQIAFSRMALTDASFLLAWLIAIGTGMRFLERRTAWRGLTMGLAIGLAQQFKYNGWLVGGLVILAAGIGVATRPEERRRGVLLRTIAWGGLAIVMAWLVVLPWYRFVEAHGGYAALLRHQRSYLGGVARWLPSFRSQADQAVALSGSRSLVAGAWTVAAVGGALIRCAASPKERPAPADLSFRVALAASAGLVLVVIPNAAWWLGLVIAPGLILSRRPATRLVGAWWLVLSILTPFYHPYARLWLPIHAAGWVVLGGMLGNGPDAARPFLRRLRGEPGPDDPGFFRFAMAWAWLLVVGTVWSMELGRDVEPPRILTGLLDPSDSLREAASRVIAILPEDVSALRFYGRPSLTYYLAGRVPVWPQPGPEAIFQGGDRRTWVLFDERINNSHVWPAEIERWNYVDLVPSDLALPTLLDIDPSYATDRRNIVFGRSAPLILLRPRLMGDSK